MRVIGAFQNAKLLIATVLLQVINPLDAFITKYLFSDFEFLKWLVIVMIIDLITGIAKVVKTKGYRAVTSKGLRDTVNKCIQYGSFVIVTHVLTHYTIDGEVQLSGMQWLSKMAYEFIILIEIKSIYENLTELNPSLDFVSVLGKKLLKLISNKYQIVKHEDNQSH